MEQNEERSAPSPAARFNAGAFVDPHLNVGFRHSQLHPSRSASGAAGRRPSASPVSVSNGVEFSAEAVEAKLVDYRSEKMAAFEIDGETMICLPQAYDLFLKYLVGGLHTVYTKLKRLEITPFVCNVEQVRALRSIGAIQPGVNRCKLISRRDFDVLYDDCASSNSKPGRPPKRNSFYGGAPFESESCFFKKQRFASLSPAQYLNKGTLSDPTNGVASPTTNQPSTVDGAFSFTSSTVNQQQQQIRGQHSAAVHQQLLQFYPFSAQQLLMAQFPHLFAKQWAECGSNYLAPGLVSSGHTLKIDDSKDEPVALKQDAPIAECGIVNLSQTGQHSDDVIPNESAKNGTKLLQPSDDPEHSFNGTEPSLVQPAGKLRAECSGGVHSADCDNDESDSDDSPGRENAEDNSADDAFNVTKIFKENIFGGAERATAGNGLADQKPGPEARDGAVDGQSPYSSVHNLLLSVARLVEITAAAARKSEQQLIKEKMEVYKAYEEEKREKARIEKTLREEQRSKLMYMKRWRLAKKQRANSTDEIGANSFARGTGISVNQTKYQNHSSMFGRQELVGTCDKSPSPDAHIDNCRL